MEIPAIQNAVRNEVVRLLTENEKYQNKLAKKLGCAPSTISDGIVNGKATVSTAKWLEFYAKLGLNTWNILETSNLVKITNLCDDAKRHHRFMAISDYTGAGKTAALRYYNRKNINGTYYVLANAAMSQTDFLEAIMAVMGIKDKGSRFKKINLICEKLNSVHNPLLIIDDFGKLNDACYRILQIIYDKTEFYAGIVIAGTEHLKKHIDSKALSKVNGFEELKRRIAKWEPLQRPSAKEKVAFLNNFGIDLAKKSQSFKDYIESCDNYGTLRELIQNELRKSAKANSVTDNQPMTNE